MNYRALAKIACRLFAIYTFIRFVSYLPAIIYPLFMKNTNANVSITILPVLPSLILSLAFSIILWTFSEKLSRLMVDDSNIQEETDIDYNKLQYIAFSVVGLVLVTLSIPNITSTLIEYIRMISMVEKSAHFSFIQYKAKLAGSIVQFIIGLWLLLGSKGILNGIKKLRKVGVKEE